MLTRLKRIIIATIELLPYQLGMMPYHFVAKLLQNALAGSGRQVGFRNSYALESAVCGLSDIDISLYFEQRPERKDVERIKSQWSRLKSLFPIVGEMNFIRLEQEDFLKTCYNSVELRRDPILVDLVGEKTKHNAAEEVVFLLRMLESEKKHFEVWMKYRLKKWNYHFDLIDMPRLDRLDSLKSLIAHICSHYEVLNEEEVEALCLKSSEELYESEDDRKVLLIFFSHVWVFLANDKDRLTLDLQMIDLNDQEIGIVCANYKWELMGLFTQLGQLDQKDNLDYYLRMLRKVIEILKSRYSNNELLELETIIDQLEEISRDSAAS